MERKIYDISMTIEGGMVSWPGDGPVAMTRMRSMDEGDRLNQSRLNLSAHTGTHIDAPLHFLKGAGGVETLPLDVLIGPAFVAHIPGVRAIDPSHLEASGVVPGTERLLLKTDNMMLRARTDFSKDYSFLTLDGARHLIDAGLRLVGIDYLSIAEFGSGEAVHRALLSAGIVIIEGLDLAEVASGTYRLTALPLKVKMGDGAPARVVLEDCRDR